ncbi:unnamed protein product, partial [Ectocarpus sp. 12 AP-2014]
CRCRPSVAGRSRSVARLRGSAVLLPAIGSSKFLLCRASSRLRRAVADHGFEHVLILSRVFAARPCCWPSARPVCPTFICKIDQVDSWRLMTRPSDIGFWLSQTTFHFPTSVKLVS